MAFKFNVCFDLSVGVFYLNFSLKSLNNIGRNPRACWRMADHAYNHFLTLCAFPVDGAN